MKLWWLSFADERGFLGAAIVEADVAWLPDAIRVAHALGINPGGSVMGGAIPEEGNELYAPHAGKLLTLEEIKKYFPDIVQRDALAKIK